jgi:arginyl-tRNA synthetase
MRIMMQTIMEKLQYEISQAFQKAGLDAEFARVTVSNRPDLCQYQCNGAMAMAKKYHQAPILLAQKVVDQLSDCDIFQTIEAQPPGFINIILSNAFLTEQFYQMCTAPRYGVKETKPKESIVIDYGGANVAKPLHVGHLRSAIIGESIKRTARYLGNHVVGDAHLGDWGLPIGLIITELQERQPELVYFDENYEGEYPKEAPFSISDLEEIYPAANRKAKEDESFKEKAQKAIAQLQAGKKGYKALWQHIIEVSVSDLHRVYDSLNVSFDLWKKESDAQPYIPDMVEKMKKDGYAHEDQGALVVDVKEPEDKKEIPPCMILKSNGATLYNTTDLATLVERRKLFSPTRVIYVVDKRQSLYFEQVFRCAQKTEIVLPETNLIFVGFGTMNGPDGKPFKTRDGGVLRLEVLLRDVVAKVEEKMVDRDMDDVTRKKTARIVGLAAIKYGDLSNQASKDYCFDIDRFTAFEGNTGPYILYTIVRTKSLLAKAEHEHIVWDTSQKVIPQEDNYQTDVILSALRWPETIEAAYEEQAPHKICQYVYELSDAYNRFYHAHKILTEEDENLRASWLQLSKMVGSLLSTAMDLLGLEVPDAM